MNYFILINDVQQGPFTLDELRQRGIQQDTLVWCEGMAQWTPAWQVEELKPIVTGQQTPPPPLQGTYGANQQSQPTPPPPPFPGSSAQTPLKKKSHKGLWTFVIILVVILFILALFNPSQAEHRKAILERIDTTTEQVDNINDPLVRGVMSGLMGMRNGMMKEVVRQLVDENLEYHNYIIFSTTTIKSDMLRKEIRTSTGFLGHVNAVSLSNIVPDIIMQQMGIDNDSDSGFDNGTTETTTTTVDGNGNETTETTKTTKKNGVTVDSLTKRVTNQIANEVAKKVKSEARQQTDSTTASGIDAIVDGVLNFLKGL